MRHLKKCRKLPAQVLLDYEALLLFDVSAWNILAILDGRLYRFLIRTQRWRFRLRHELCRDGRFIINND
jgi:hypothetical protein